MLQLKKITKIYQTEDLKQTALDKVSINFRPNEFVSILGPSGSGKTTLLNIIGGLDHYDSGDLTINEISTKKFKDSDWDSYRNHRVGFVFQSYNLIPHQTVLANVELALTLSGVSRSERKKRAKAALKKVGLEKHINKKPSQLSGGQMQRVAIARALVNNPDILLADEPTGALDSETSEQIMKIIKDVAKDRLVIMVTHNPELAEKYSTRIVKVKDGELIDDSNPYDGAEDTRDDAEEVEQKSGKTSMNLGTAISLSLNNLMTKKGRTLLTAFAGSIGIIGIALILSLSSGMNNYIKDQQKAAMLSYPISITDTAMDVTSMMMVGSDDKFENHASDGVYATPAWIQYSSEFMSSITENNLKDFKKYLDNPDSEIHQYVGAGGIVYSYSADFSLFGYDPDGKLINADGSTFGLDAMSNAMMGGGDMTNYSDNMSSMGMNVLPTARQIMPGPDDELINPAIKESYDVVAGHWPESHEELVLILDEGGEMNLATLYNLGILPAKEYQEILLDFLADKPLDDLETIKLDYDDVLGHELHLLTASDFYKKGQNGLYSSVSEDATAVAKLVKDQSLTLKIAGVVRQKPDSDLTISSALGYTYDLTEWIAKHTDNSEVVKAQEKSPNASVITGLKFGTAGETGTLLTLDDTYTMLGKIDLDSPSAIDIYADSFEDKDGIIKSIDNYNHTVKEEDKISYTDYVGLLMDSITVIVNAISYVLIAFVSISLIVSSIMIAIITYISVLERTKEIGILRAIGASKRDVTRVFNAETLIEGAVSGILGIVVTLILILPINAVIEAITEIPHMAKLPVMGGIILVLISVVLTVIAGLIPSKMASKKDPVEALRSE